MVRSKRVNAYSDNAVLSEYYGLSTDTKPTENVATGSVFTEVDTGATFLYDEESEDWTEVESGSSGGGGGGDLFELATTGVTTFPAKSEVVEKDEGYYNMIIGSFTPVDDQGDIYVPAFSYSVDGNTINTMGGHNPQGEIAIGVNNYLFVENTVYIQIYNFDGPNEITISTPEIKAYYMSDEALAIFPSGNLA